MIAEAGTIEDLKRSVLTIEAVEFTCGRRIVPNFTILPGTGRVDSACGMDDCPACREEAQRSWERSRDAYYKLRQMIAECHRDH